MERAPVEGDADSQWSIREAALREFTIPPLPYPHISLYPGPSCVHPRGGPPASRPLSSYANSEIT